MQKRLTRMKNGKTTFGQTLVATLLLATTPAIAQQTPTAAPTEPASAPTPVDAQKAEALRLLKEGVEAAKADNWPLAHKHFTQSVELDPVPFTIMQLGRAELMLGNAAQAAEHFEYYLLETCLLDEKRCDAQIEGAVRKLFEEAKAKCATVRLAVNAPGAEIYVDDKRIDDKHLSGRVYLPPGPHTFEAKKRGYASASRQSDLVAGTQIDLALTLTPQIRTDDARQNDARVDNRWLKANLGVAGGLVLLGVGAAIGANVAHPSNSERQSLSDNEYNNRQVMKGGFTYASIASFVGAAAVGGVTLGYVFTRSNQSGDAKSPPKAAVRIVPTLGGVVVQGNWF
jgi:hypothetical protein